MIDCVYCGYEVCASDETLMFGWMMFSKIISKVSLTSYPLYNKVALSDYVMNPIDTHVYGPGVIFWMLSLKKPPPVDVYVATGVGGCRCPICWSAIRRAPPRLEVDK